MFLMLQILLVVLHDPLFRHPLIPVVLPSLVMHMIRWAVVMFSVALKEHDLVDLLLKFSFHVYLGLMHAGLVVYFGLVKVWPVETKHLLMDIIHKFSAFRWLAYF